jgi:His-Xaa-Ser system protein HxsD
MLRKYAEKNYDVVIMLPLDIYPLESVCIAAYDFMDDFYFYIYRDGGAGKERSVEVALKARNQSGKDLDCSIGRFQNELVRQALRAATAKMNKDIRKHVIGRALASALPAEIKDSGSQVKEKIMNPET